MADLVVSAFTLCELENQKTRKANLQALWQHVLPGGVMVSLFVELSCTIFQLLKVVLEQGTQLGFHIISEARESFLNKSRHGVFQQAKILAPVLTHTHPKLRFLPLSQCPHSEVCPMLERDPPICYFMQRMDKTPLQMARERGRQYKDFSFSYLVVVKGWSYDTCLNLGMLDENANAVPARIVSHQPRKRKGHVTFSVCCDDGKLKTAVVSKKMGSGVYKAARKSKLGDGFDVSQASLKTNA